MRKAFIVLETKPYCMGVYLVFAESEKEAKTTLFSYEQSIRGNTREVQMEVQAPFKGELVVELGVYLE
jgi:hypothetical protein